MAKDVQNSPAMSKLLKLLNSPKMAAEIGQTLAEVAAELADAYAERNHWRNTATGTIAEMKILAGIMLMKQPDRRLVIKKSEMLQIPRELELFYDTPEPGVKVYALRVRAKPDAEVVLQ